MKYSITINDDDYLKFNLFYTCRIYFGQRSLHSIRLFFPIICVILLFSFLLCGYDLLFILIEVVLMSILSAISFFRAPKVLKRIMRKNIARMKKNGKLPYHAFSEIEFQDSMLVETFDQGEYRLNYTDIEQIYFEDEYIYIFYTALQAFIIPCHCLGGEKEHVIAFLREKTS